MADIAGLFIPMILGILLGMIPVARDGMKATGISFKQVVKTNPYVQTILAGAVFLFVSLIIIELSLLAR